MHLGMELVFIILFKEGVPLAGTRDMIYELKIACKVLRSKIHVFSVEINKTLYG